MAKSTTVAWLSEAIAQAARSAHFCADGCLADVDPGLEVEGLGLVKLPLKRTQAKELIAKCRAAPYGKGTQTLVNKKVRNTFELDPKKFHLSDEWNAAVAAAAQHAAGELGLPAEELQARLYKLLVYERGGFFLPHRDSEKLDRMVASMIVVLPSPFEGGKLIVRHGAVERPFSLDEAAKGNSACYVAFYADCEHEVRQVTHGVRLCLAYNLVLQKKKGRKAAAATDSPATTSPAPAEALAESIRSWVEAQPATPLVFALEHQYTQRGLSLELLKGADRELGELVVAGAERANCRVYLAQVSRHLLQSADDGSGYDRYDRYGYSSQPRGPVEIGETYEDELYGAQWTDVSGKKQPWEELPLDLEAIVSRVPIEDWKPTSESYEGYTGNAGNTLDRWYQRSAFVVWSQEQHFDVLAGGGAEKCVPLFCSMTARLAKTPKKRFDAARDECLRFARAIIAHWPRQMYRFAGLKGQAGSFSNHFRDELLELHDRETISKFLRTLAERDQELPLSSFVSAACREFGAAAFGEELKGLILVWPLDHGRQSIVLRDIEWLCRFCSDIKGDPDRTALARELCGLVVERFCTPIPPQRPSYWGPRERPEPSVAESALPLLMKALLACKFDQGLARVIDFVERNADEFRLSVAQVPCLNAVAPWAQKRFGQVPPRLLAWLNSVRGQLESATASRPQPPADWARPANVDCSCRSCGQLNAFLADARQEVGRIAAREDLRSHVIEMIRRRRCDVKHALERKGSPFSLVLTKTTGSYDRALKQFEADQKLLASLPSV